MESALIIHRLHFAFTITYHYLFPQLTMGLAPLIFVFSAASTLLAVFYGAAFATCPNLLPASTDAAFSLTVYNAKTGAYSLSVGLVWWLIGITLAVGYFTFLYRSFRGKVAAGDESHY